MSAEDVMLYEDLKCGYCDHSGDTQCDCSIFYDLDLNTCVRKKMVFKAAEAEVAEKETNEEDAEESSELDS